MSNVDLDKIQGVIETEISKATSTERKRIVTLVKSFAKDLVDSIQSGEDSEDDIPVVKKTVKKTVKKIIPEEPAEEPADSETSEEPIDGATYDISEVEDHEVEESEYSDKKVAELRKLCKERNITVPKGYKADDIIKMLILNDEDA